MADDDDLIAAIYDAIMDPSGWEEVVKRLTEATNSVSGALLIHLADAAHVTTLCSVGPVYADAYAQTYYKINPLVAAIATIAPGKIWSGTNITQTGSFRASAFFNEWVRP